MQLLLDQIQLRTAEGDPVATLALRSAFKGNPGAGEEIYNQVLNLFNQMASGLIPITNFIADRTVTKEHATHIMRGMSALPTTLTIRKNTGSAPEYDWNDDPVYATFFSVLQRGAGEITIVGEDDVEVVAPAGYLPKPRAQNSLVTFVMDAQGTWFCTGDMAFDE